MRATDGHAGLLLVSGRSAEALAEQAAAWAGWLREHPEVAWVDVLHTAAHRRTHFEHRAVVDVVDVRAAEAALAGLAAGGDASTLVRGVARGEARVGLLFTGQGSQRAGMGAGLYGRDAVFTAAFDAVCAALDRHLDRPLAPLVLGRCADPEAIDRTALTQPALFALEVALFRRWQAWGLVPAALIGHSLGELTAAFVAGVMTLEDAARVVAARGRLMQAMPAGGASAAIEGSEDEVRAVLAAGAEIAGIAGRRQTVISGDAAAVEATMAVMAASGRRVRRLAVSHAFHSHHMDGMLAEYGTSRGPG